MFPPSVPSVTAEAVADGAALVDVRELDEWQAGHAPGALHIPLGQLTGRLGELPEGELVVVCRSGGRSARAVAWLNQNGFEALNLDGGMQAWDGSGRPMVAELGAEPFVR